MSVDDIMEISDTGGSQTTGIWRTHFLIFEGHVTAVSSQVHQLFQEMPFFLYLFLIKLLKKKENGFSLLYPVSKEDGV